MNAITEWALASVADNGAPILLFLTFIGSLGIPFPVTIVIVGAGAFANTGLLDWRLAAAACLLGAALADHSEYLLGRWGNSWLRGRFEDQPAWQQAQATLNRQGAWAILLTRFWLTPLAPAVNFLAGSRYPYRRFLFYDVVGQLLWVLLYGGLGYLFAAQWQQVSMAAGAFSTISIMVCGAAFGLYWLALRRNRMRGTVHDGK